MSFYRSYLVREDIITSHLSHLEHLPPLLLPTAATPPVHLLPTAVGNLTAPIPLEESCQKSRLQPQTRLLWSRPKAGSGLAARSLQNCYCSFLPMLKLKTNAVQCKSAFLAKINEWFACAAYWREASNTVYMQGPYSPTPAKKKVAPLPTLKAPALLCFSSHLSLFGCFSKGG